MLTGLAQAVLLSWGWRRHAIAFGAGALSALAMAPVHAGPILFLTLPVLVLLIDSAATAGRQSLRRLRPAAAIGWWFGFGYFLGGLWWIGAAFLVEPGLVFLMPLAVLALPAGLALFTAAGVVVARLLWSDSPLRLFALAAGLGAAEYARGQLFTGFPWNLIGQAATFTDVTAQAVSVIGIYGVTLVAILVFAVPVLLVEPGQTRPRLKTTVIALAGLLVAADLGFGFYRLAGAEAAADGARIRIVQPAIDQSQKWSPERRQETLDILAELSERKTDSETLGAMSFQLIIWPETALPFFLTEEPTALTRIGELLPPGTALVTGAPRAEPTPAGRRYYNSIYVVDDGGRIVDAYDKAHLVPFGEYLPAAGLLEPLGLRQLVHGVGGFSAGSGRRTIEVPGTPPAGPLICYEIIFPGAAIDATKRPGYLINLTNDAWFGATAGPYQHLDLARLRAIEEGLPVVRAANSGISAIIDARGRILARSPLGERMVLDGNLPRGEDATVFSRYGRQTFLALIVIFGMISLASGRLRPTKR